MKRLATQIRAFARDESGAAVAEYGLLLAIVAVGMITLLITFKDALITWWTTLQGSITATPNSPSGGGATP
jgi:Flp pilus assembly pilin Flp